MITFAKWLGLVFVVMGIVVVGDHILPQHQEARVDLETGGELEFEYFDQPRTIAWTGRPQQVLTYGRLLLATIDNRDSSSPVFVAEPKDDQWVWGESLTRTLVISGRWVGNACGYWYDQYGQCIPWVEIENITSI